ncbi:MAG: hypothetical protein ACI4LE_02070, partial [Faecalibacterium sp.]
MAWFTPDYSQSGPGVDKNTPRKKGFARYWEIVTRDAFDLLRGSCLTFLAALPGLLALVVALLSGAVLPAILAGAFLGALAGPFYCAMQNSILRALRDEPGYWWHTFRRVLGKEWRGWVLPGALAGAVLGVQLWACVQLLGSGQATLNLLFSTLLSLLAGTALGGWLFPQLAVIKLPFAAALKNSLLLAVRYPGKTLSMTLTRLLLWALAALFLPYSLPLVPLLFLWAIPLAGTQ